MSGLTSHEVDAAASYVEDRCQEELAMMVERDGERLRISWRDLWQYDRDLAEDLITHPRRILHAFETGLEQSDLDPKVEGTFDTYIDRGDVTFAINDLGERKRPISELRHDDVGTYVAVESQVDMRTQVEPFIVKAAVKCLTEGCGHIEYLPQSGDEVQLPYKCPHCDNQGPFTIADGESVYEDQQIIEISDPPESSTGRSDSIIVEAYNELAGLVEAGDRVVVNGVLETKSIAGESSPKRRRPLRMRALDIEQTATGYEDITPERMSEIRELANADDLYHQLADSIAPHILTDDRGDDIKLCIVLQLFGGVEREMESGFKRGNLNVLLVGDPGTAKSQYLEAANRIAPKSVKVSGKNARPAGMTATAVQSEHTGEWTLKAGALVKASGGLACIDEFDKMRGETISSLHEALEDQTISVAKADINTTVPARAAVLAAANPKAGYFNFDRFKNLSEQIEIGPAIISRFDLIFGMQDIVDEEHDRATAKHQHATGDPGQADPEPAIPHDLLTEYIAYARQNIEPTFADEAVEDELVEFYVDTRQDALAASGDSVQPVGPRVNEVLRRVAQASARARLSETVDMDDAELAIRLFKRTVGEVGLTEEGIIDGGKLDGGYQEFTQQELRDELYSIVSELEEDYDDGAPRDVIVNVAQERGAERGRAAHILKEMLKRKDGGLYQPATGKFRTT